MDELPGYLTDEALAQRVADSDAIGVFSDNGFAFVFWPLSRSWGYYEMTTYKQEGGGWTAVFDQGDSGVPNAAEPFHGGWTSGFAWRLGRSFRLGKSKPGPVTIEYRGERFEVAPDPQGYWAFIRETSPEDEDFDAPRFIPSHQV